MIKGRIPVNPHGGALSEGGTQGSGHTREAIHQLQGVAGDRQVRGCRMHCSCSEGSSSTRKVRCFGRKAVESSQSTGEEAWGGG